MVSPREKPSFACVEESSPQHVIVQSTPLRQRLNPAQRSFPSCLKNTPIAFPGCIAIVSRFTSASRGMTIVALFPVRLMYIQEGGRSVSAAVVKTEVADQALVSGMSTARTLQEYVVGIWRPGRDAELAVPACLAMSSVEKSGDRETCRWYPIASREGSHRSTGLVVSRSEEASCRERV